MMNKTEKGNKFELDYHIDHNGEVMPFCSMLGCFEQICYFELRKVSDVNPWIYFCDNLNLGIENGNAHVMTTEVRDRYQKAERWVIEENHFEKISSLIAQEGEVALRTAFNYVPNYTWSEEGKEGLHTAHMTYVIGEDADGYYIVDSPTNFLNIETIRHKDNPSIVKIPKQNFAEAFEKYCEICKVRFSNLYEAEGEVDYLKEILKETVEWYYMEPEGDTVVGRKALLYMLEQCDAGGVDLFLPFFMYYLMVSRRLLLKRGMNLCSSRIENRGGAMEYLDRSIGYWTEIKELSFAHLYDHKKVEGEVRGLMGPLMENEDRLMESLEKIIHE